MARSQPNQCASPTKKGKWISIQKLFLIPSICSSNCEMLPMEIHALQVRLKKIESNVVTFPLVRNTSSKPEKLTQKTRRNYPVWNTPQHK
jgi:hypothetical protein